MRFATFALLAGLAVGCAQDESRALIVLKMSFASGVAGPLSKTVVRFPFANETQRESVLDGADQPQPTMKDPVEVGFFVPGLEGSIDVRADSYDARGCKVASGTAMNVHVQPGKVTNAPLVLKPVRPAECPVDSGVDGTNDGGGIDAADGGVDTAEAGKPDGSSEARDAGDASDASDASEARDGGVDDASDAKAEAGADAKAEAGASDADDAGEVAPPDGGSEAPAGPTCESYCSWLVPACPGNAESAGGVASCVKLCNLFFPPSGGKVSSDQLVCRQESMTAPAASLKCTAGGFSGGGLCGLGDVFHNWCDVYCEFATTVCDRFGTTPIQCVQNCTGFGTFPPDATTGDNVACRIRQLIIAGGLEGSARASVCAGASAAPTAGPCR